MIRYGRKDNMKPNSSRSVLRGLVGGYLLYLAYELLKNLISNTPTTMPRWVAILAITAFTVIGIMLLINAWTVWKKGKEDQDTDPVELEEKKSEEEPGQDSSDQ